MKRLIIFVLAVMAMSACTKYITNEVASYSLNAIAPGDDETKTSLSKGEGSNWNVLWSEDDALRVKVSGDGSSASNYAVYTLDTGAGTGSGVFKGTVEAPDEVFAFYPSSLVDVINSRGMFFQTPVNQTYTAGGVANNSLPIYAKGSKDNLTFNHTCAVLGIQLWTDQSDVAISNVSIESPDQISGQRYFKKNDFSRPYIASGPRYLVNVNCNTLAISQDSNNPTIVYAILGTDSPQKVVESLTITVAFSNGTSVFRTKTSMAVSWGKVYKLAPWKISQSSPDLQINIDGSGWNAWDGGAITSPITTSIAVKGTNSGLFEASMKNIISKVKSGSEVIDIDLSQVSAINGFTEITKSEDFFFNNNKIGDVLLPEGIQTIKLQAFEGSSIDTLTIPSSVNNIGLNILRLCKSTSGFNVNASNPKYIAFDGQLYSKNGTEPGTYTLQEVSCGKTGSYTIAPNTTVIGNAAFQWSHLSSVIIPASVTTINKYAFYVAHNLSSITLLGETPPVFSGIPWVLPYFAGYQVSTPKTITVPTGSESTYTGSDWKTYFVDQAGFTINH